MSVHLQSALILLLALLAAACLALVLPSDSGVAGLPLRLAAAAGLGVAVTLLVVLGAPALRRRGAQERAPREVGAAEAAYRRGLAAREAGRAGAAAELFAAAIASDPEHASAHAALGELAAERGDAPTALLHALQALRSDSAPARQVAAARAYEGAGRPDAAAAAYRDVVAVAPDHVVAWRGLRDLAIAAGRWADALAAQERVVALAPEGPRRVEEQDGLAGIHYELGRARLAQGDQRAARAAFEAARRAKPDFVPAVLAIGDLHAAAGRSAEALAAWTAGLAAGPVLPLLSRIEHLHRAADRPSQMITLYAEAQARWPDSLAVAVQLGRVYFELAMLDEAAEQFEKIEVRAPDLPVIHAYLGAIFEQRGDARGAFQEYRELIRLASSFDWPHRCGACGAPQPRWMDRCRACARWNTSRP